MNEKPTLIIGDVHGHFDRLESLLLQEGIIGPCPDCHGTGDASTPITFEPEGPLGGASIDGDESDLMITFDSDPHCRTCYGDGQCRINYDVRVVQLGDLGHFGVDASPTGDHLCYLYADKHRWIDTVLWGNHDRAVADPNSHVFRGYSPPADDVREIFQSLRDQKRLVMATSAHGYLIVHAGISRAFKVLTMGHDAMTFASYLNLVDNAKLDLLREKGVNGVITIPEQRRFRAIDDISDARGGRAKSGGCLWMDWDREEHLDGKPFRYVCGHSARHDGEPVEDEYGNWNIDIGGKFEPRLAGLWLESGRNPRIVKVKDELNTTVG